MGGSLATDADTRPVDSRSRSAELRIGAGLAIAGTVLHATTGAFHGALTAGTDRSSSATVFQHVNDHPSWAVINLGMLVATLTWLGAVLVLARHSGSGSTWRTFLGQLAAAILTVGVASATLLFLIDAVVLPNLATQWATASPERQAELVAMGDTVQVLIRVPLFHVLPLFVFGLPFALAGAAHVGRGTLLPSWIGYLGLLAGSASFVTGCLWVLDLNVIPETIMWAVYQPLSWVWVIAAGICLWRGSHPTKPLEQATPTNP